MANLPCGIIYHEIQITTGVDASEIHRVLREERLKQERVANADIGTAEDTQSRPLLCHHQPHKGTCKIS